MENELKECKKMISFYKPIANKNRKLVDTNMKLLDKNAELEKEIKKLKKKVNYLHNHYGEIIKERQLNDRKNQQLSR